MFYRLGLFLIAMISIMSLGSAYYVNYNSFNNYYVPDYVPSYMTGSYYTYSVPYTAYTGYYYPQYTYTYQYNYPAYNTARYYPATSYNYVRNTSFNLYVG